LLPENRIIHNHWYFVLCTGADFCVAARLSSRAGSGVARTLDSTKDSSSFEDAARFAGGESNVFLIPQSFISMALLIATTLVAGFFAYIHNIKRQTYLLLWTTGWVVFALHYVGPTVAPNSAGSPLQSALNHWLFALSGVLFFLGAQLYSQQKAWKVPALVVSVFFGLWAGGNATNTISVSVLIPASLLYVGVAVVFWQESRRQET